MSAAAQAAAGRTLAPWTILARLVRPQGRRGELLAEILTDFPGRFAERKRVFLLRAETDTVPLREAALESHWMHKGRVVLKFAAVDSITDAEALRNLLVAIPAAERTALTDGSVYVSDLIGCELFDLNQNGARVGVIRDFDRASNLLAVTTVSGDEALIPFVRSYLETMDLAANRVTMRLPSGLLDINAPMTDEERREANEPDSGVDEA